MNIFKYCVSLYMIYQYEHILKSSEIENIKIFEDHCFAYSVLHLRSLFFSSVSVALSLLLSFSRLENVLYSTYGTVIRVELLICLVSKFHYL